VQVCKQAPPFLSHKGSNGGTTHSTVHGAILALVDPRFRTAAIIAWRSEANFLIFYFLRPIN